MWKESFPGGECCKKFSRKNRERQREEERELWGDR